MRKQGRVCLDELVTVPAVWDDRTRWNGFLCPWLDREAVETVMAAFAQLEAETGERMPSIGWEGDVLLLTEYDGETDYFVERLEPDVEGRYQLGGFSWVWAEDTDPQDD